MLFNRAEISSKTMCLSGALSASPGYLANGEKRAGQRAATAGPSVAVPIYRDECRMTELLTP